jgi:hypothetical protein
VREALSDYEVSRRCIVIYHHSDGTQLKESAKTRNLQGSAHTSKQQGEYRHRGPWFGPCESKGREKVNSTSKPLPLDILTAVTGDCDDFVQR